MLVGLTALALASGALAETRPNVVLVMADDMGWAQTGYYGHPVMKTPNLDAMAGNGLRMDRFYAGAPSCTPTRASVLTGRTNDRTGAFRVGHSIDKQEKLLSTAFREAGYATAHFGKWHLNQGGPKGHPLPADDPHNPGELGSTTGWVRPAGSTGSTSRAAGSNSAATARSSSFRATARKSSSMKR